MTHRPVHQTAVMHAPSTTAIAWLNLALIAVAVASLLSYVVAANGLAAQAWRFSDAQDEIVGLLDTRNGLVAQQSALEDRTVLSALAADAGMVPAGSVVYLVQDKPVAAR
jgi:hypothetical protein